MASAVRTIIGRAALLVVLVTGGLLGPGADPADAVTRNSSAVTFTVDHAAKTITVHVSLTIYPGCSGDPAGNEADQAVACTGVSSQGATTFLARKIKEGIENFWNKKAPGYRCYKLIVVVDVEVGTSRERVSRGRVAVRVDPSRGGIRDYVDNSGITPGPWNSNDPADRVEPANDGAHETTWSEAAQDDGWTYAHEAGHVMGLGDAYEDVPDAHGNTVGARPRAGAPEDIMSTDPTRIDPATVNLLIERNRDRLVDTKGQKVDLKDLRCDFKLEVDMQMIGTNRAFKGKVTVHGTIEMHVVGGQLPLGNDWIPYEGTGTLTYATVPIGHAPCTFTYKGRGSFLTGASMSVKFPINPDELKVTVAPRLDGLARDKLVARGCPTGGVVVKPVTLITLFYTDRLGRDWVISDWERTSSFDKDDKFDGRYSGHCARSLCDERDTFTLAELPNR